MAVTKSDAFLMPSVNSEIQYDIDSRAVAPLDEPPTPRHDVHFICAAQATPSPPPPFKIVPIDQKGLGMVATTSLTRGNVILIEAPIIRTVRSSSNSMAQSQFYKLSQEDKDKVLALANIHDPNIKPLRGIMWTNSIGLRGTDEGVGLFITASRINHSCRPNSNSSWDPETGLMTLIATRDISVGEEITSTYVKGFATHAHRRRHLRDLLRFICSCQLCTAPHLCVSDYRITEINYIQEKRERELKWSSTILRLLDIKLLLTLYREEGIDGWEVAEAYALGYMVALRQSDVYKAWYFADKTAAEYAVVDGEWSVKARQWRETARETKRQAIEAGESEHLPDTQEMGVKKWLFRDKMVTAGWDLIPERVNELCFTLSRRSRELSPRPHDSHSPDASQHHRQSRHAMSSTPRLRSGYPATPGTVNRRHETPSTVASSSTISTTRSSTNRSPTLPLAPESVPADIKAPNPVIPLTVLDAPSQRFYAIGLYAVLLVWKLYDWLSVAEEGYGSYGMFLKWDIIDLVYLFGVPELRIPWLVWSQSFVTGLYVVHLILNWLLMFLIPIPFVPALLAFVKVFYDREISISEHNVKVSSILNNHSLIMGKQIINILPEGSAVLNPDKIPYCLADTKPKNSISLPIHFNATIPAEIELIRTDIFTLKEEVIKIPNREVSKLAKLVRQQNADPASDGFQWEYPIKKTGIYRLGKVLDDYKLEVQRLTEDTYVVPCPQARIEAGQSSSRCINDLSDMSLEVTGTPPLKIFYNRTINGEDHGFHIQSLRPDGFSSPLIGSSALVGGESPDLSWVRPSKITVRLNESMTYPGAWEYTVNEVHDGFGNVVDYGSLSDDPSRSSRKPLSHQFTVKERPKVHMDRCDLKSPLKIAKGESGLLPIGFSMAGAVDDTSHKITWAFSPIDSLTNSGEHGDQMSMGSYSARNSKDQPRISQPGLYTLKSVTSGQCEGQVQEPSSCLVLNPLEPHLSLRTEEITDNCAGNSIGLRVDLDFVGTAPFDVHYTIIEKDSGKKEGKTHHVGGLRSQLELIPKSAGTYQYIFNSIDDAVYKRVAITGQDKILEQVVKPAASAIFKDADKTISACLDEEVEREIYFFGDPPFNLEWEIVHDGKRKTFRVNDISERTHKIKTAPLSKGGEYNMALSSVGDARGCRTFLQDSIKINVRLQRPRAAFGTLEQKRSTMAVENTHVRLPLRLQGEGPWNVGYRNKNVSEAVIERKVSGPNDYLVVKNSGIYEIVGVTDKQCPGTIDKSASAFKVDWFPRPELSLVPSESISQGSDGAFVKRDVCEGDIDGFEINLKGTPPYHVEYERRWKSLQGSVESKRRKFDAALGKAAVSVDTASPGHYSYRFFGLADHLYDTETGSTQLVVEQRVNAKPTASFAKPNQSFKFCAEEQEHEETIPIKLTGVAPFYVEIEVKHQAGAAPQVYSIPAIHTTSHGMRIPREHLRLGTQQIRIRRVSDARSCQRKYEMGGPSVQVQLFDAPSIYPLETREDYCVGERIAFTLSGTPPFDITYDFNGRWSAKSPTTTFRRVAEKPGQFTINSVSDKASECRAAVNIPKTIHPLPSVRISQGRQSRVDIHEGGEVDILFEFGGTPPFEFTYTRSSNARKGQRSVVLETRHETSHENTMVVKASQEGTYEVVAIKDRYCSFSTQQVEKKDRR